MSRKIVIVGGVAGGATAAARARRLDERAEIVVLERGPHISFANCGLPYHIGGEIAERENLILQTPATLGQRYNLDIRTRSEVIAIDRAKRRVQVRNLTDDCEYEEPYDVLVLSPGAEPLRPPIPGVDLPQVYTLRNVEDVDRIKRAVDEGARRALVIGGGFIGLEMAENLRQRDLDVTLVELLPQVMPPIDPEMAAPVHQELRAHGVQLHLNDAAASIEATNGGVQVALKSGATIDVDLVILAAGVRPETALARDAGLELNQRGAIVVDDHMRTSDQSIYAVGDAVQIRDFVLDQPTQIPLAGPANRQARIAIDNICGRDSRFRGAQGTSVVRVFGLTVASTGAAEKTLQRDGVDYRKVYVLPGNHVGYFPGAEQMIFKLLFTPDTGRILGAQIVGGAGVDKRVDVIATAIQAGLTVYDLEETELAYAPQYGAAKDPVNLVGFVASNILRGDADVIYAEDMPEDLLGEFTLVDVRDAAEFRTGHLAGAVLIPLTELRDRWREIPTNKPVVAYCASGQRSYYATRILRQLGLPSRNLAGGLRVYRCVHPPAAAEPAVAASECCG